MIKILFIGHERDFNGASKSMIEVIDFLSDKYHFFVLTAYKNGDLINKLKEMNIETIVMPFFRWSDRKNNILRWILYNIRWYLWGNRINQKTANKIAEFIKEKNIDIIHTNSSVVDIGLRVKKITKVPHIMHIREFGDLDFKIFPFMPQKAFYKKMNGGSDLFICNSKAVAKHYSLLESTKKIVIYNGVSPRYSIKKQYTVKADINLLIAGRICKEKGQDVAVKAVEYLVNKGITNIRLYIAGKGNIIISPYLTPYIKVLGVVDDMVELRKKMDIELVCSYAEAFGRVTVEAMLSGLPVIGSDSGGTPELINDSVNGFLFKNGDSIDLANKIEYFIEHRNQIEEMGNAAHAYAYNNFLIERCASDIEREYIKILKP